MATALVVDDSVTERRRAARLLEKGTDLAVVEAADGQEALEAVARKRPDVIVTDLRMPRLDGLGLVEALRASHPGLPVVLMTAHGNEDIAAEALRKGAASYVPKRLLGQDLVNIVEELRDVTRKQRERERAERLLEEVAYELKVDHDLRSIRSVTRFLRDEAAQRDLGDETDVMRLGVALDEALCNAVHHGNLEVSSELREESIEAYLAEIAKRALEQPYADRRVRVTARFDKNGFECVIRDEGPGFDPATLPDPVDAANLDRPSGRGLMLIKTFMDEARHNEKGNEITLVKRRPACAEA